MFFDFYSRLYLVNPFNFNHIRHILNSYKCLVESPKRGRCPDKFTVAGHSYFLDFDCLLKEVKQIIWRKLYEFNQVVLRHLRVNIGGRVHYIIQNNR